MSPTVSDAGSVKPAHGQITQNAVLMTVFLLLQKLLALLQQVMIGRVSGLSAEADAFYIAQTIPLLVGSLIMVALTNTLIPILRAGEDRRAAGLFVNILAFLTLSSLMLWTLAPGVVRLLGQGLPPFGSETAVRLLREMAALILIQGATGILNALYYRRFRFVAPSLAGCLLYVGAITGVALRPWAGIDSFAWGLVAGGAAQVVMLCWFVGRQEWHRPLFQWGPLAGFSKSFLNILIVSAVSVSLIADRAFASFGRPGGVTAVTLASGLITIPSTLVVFTLNSAVLPALVALREDGEAFAGVLRHAITYIALFVGPANLILFFASLPLIRILFHSARFDSDSLQLTSALVVAYSVGIFGTAIKDVLGNAFIALGKEWIPMAAGIAGVGASIMLKLLFLPGNLTWIASTTSIGMWLTAGILLVVTAIRIPLHWLRLWRENGLRLLVVNGLFFGLCLALRRSLQSQSYLPLIALASAGAVHLAVTGLGLRNKRI